MIIKVREQAGTDAGRKFDYQMAVALDYLLNEIDSDAIVLIETLEDFAVFRNVGLEDEIVDIYQVGKSHRQIGYGRMTSKLTWHSPTVEQMTRTSEYK